MNYLRCAFINQKQEALLVIDLNPGLSAL